MQFDYYRSSESGQFTFYRIPKELFTNPLFSGLSTDAKLLYGLMLDRIGLSVRSGWVDEEDHVYIYYSMAEIMTQLQCGHNKAIRLLKELDQGIGLIRRKRQGLGQPDRIYVMNFITGAESQTSDYGNSDHDDVPEGPEDDTTSEEVQTSDFGNSGVENTVQNGGFRLSREENQTSHNGNSACQTSFFETSGLPISGVPVFPKAEWNDNNINNTYMSDTDPIYSISPVSVEGTPMDGMDGYDAESAKNYLRDKWGLIALRDQYSPSQLEGVLSLGADILTSGAPTVRVGKQDLPIAQVRQRLLSLDFTHIDYVLECMNKNTAPVRNMRSYLLTALYNAPLTIDAYYANLVAQHEGIA